MPDLKVFSQIPVFYRTLFSSKSVINDDFWVPMDNEAQSVKNAFQRHKNGFGGAVLITDKSRAAINENCKVLGIGVAVKVNGLLSRY